MAAKKAASPDIDAFISAHEKGVGVPIPEDAYADLRYFAARAKEGKVIGFTGIQKWMQERYGLALGRTKLYNEAVKAGVKPWWTK